MVNTLSVIEYTYSKIILNTSVYIREKQLKATQAKSIGRFSEAGLLE